MVFISLQYERIHVQNRRTIVPIKKIQQPAHRSKVNTDNNYCILLDAYIRASKLYIDDILWTDVLVFHRIILVDASVFLILQLLASHPRCQILHITSHHFKYQVNPRQNDKVYTKGIEANLVGILQAIHRFKAEFQKYGIVISIYKDQPIEPMQDSFRKSIILCILVTNTLLTCIRVLL